MAFLNGKVALVTGGSRGIGRAIAHALAGEGAAVAITGRDEARLAEARRTLEEARPAGAGRSGSPGMIDARRADVRSYDDIDAAVRGTVDRFGGLDILVNNAGVGVFTNVSDMTPSQWADVIDTNLTGVFNACHAALPHLRRRGGGYIINISSLSGTNPFAGAAAYCASKAGLNAFSEALMQELRHEDIRVSYVMPGSVSTGFANGDAAKGADWKVAPEEVAAVVVNLLRHNPRSLPSRVELRPSKPPRK
jgi:NAD(P)-dependent dehydrogenase (short-subunit alcohol dehydrogenase family)